MPKRKKYHQLSMKYHRTIRLHSQHVHALLEPSGVLPGQPPVLFSLLVEPGVTQKELGARIAVRPATLTTILQRMEKSDLIIRQVDTCDQRKIRVYLTPKGEMAANATSQILSVLETQMFVGISDEELQMFEQVLQKIEKNLTVVSKVKGEMQNV